jgi:hypothetical protein
VIVPCWRTLASKRTEPASRCFAIKPATAQPFLRWFVICPRASTLGYSISSLSNTHWTCPGGSPATLVFSFAPAAVPASRQQTRRPSSSLPKNRRMQNAPCLHPPGWLPKNRGVQNAPCLHLSGTPNITAQNARYLRAQTSSSTPR